MAKDLNKFGANVYFLPKYEGGISADAILHINDKYVITDFKCLTTNLWDTIQKKLRHGFDQANMHVTLKLTGANTKDFSDAIDYMIRNKIPIGDIELINKYGKVIQLSQKELQTGKYINKIRGKL